MPGSESLKDFRSEPVQQFLLFREFRSQSTMVQLEVNIRFGSVSVKELRSVSDEELRIKSISKWFVQSQSKS
jgi:hypothetical protein